MGPLQTVRFKLARRKSEAARKVYDREPSEANRAALVDAYCTEGMIRYRKLLNALSDR